MKLPHTLLLLAAGVAVATTPLAAGAAEAATPQRQAEVASRGADVMPFSLAATTHVFTKTPDGGVQRVVAKDRADARQSALVRQHLRELQARFTAGDWAAPARIHGDAMPGVAALRAAKTGQVAIAYREVDGGAELVFRSADPGLVRALHDWFDAQLSDHGHDATAGPHVHDMHDMHDDHDMHDAHAAHGPHDAAASAAEAPVPRR